MSERLADPESLLGQDGDPQLVLVLRDAHRHPWQRAAAEALLEKAKDGITVEVGVPLWRPSGTSAYLATHGAGRVNLEAAADCLLEAD